MLRPGGWIRRRGTWNRPSNRVGVLEINEIRGGKVTLDATTLFFQIVNFFILAGWLMGAVLALIRLRRRQLGEVARVLWAILILVIPLLGSLAFFIVKPGKPE